MARRYSRKKGTSGSTKPVNIDNSAWVNKDVKAIKELIIELSKAENTSSQIGLILRDSYATPDVKAICGVKINKIIADAGLKKEVPDDLLALIKKDIAIAKHIETSKKDMTAKRGQQLTLSKIDRLVRYYKSTGVLNASWKYERSKAVQWIV